MALFDDLGFGGFSAGASGIAGGGGHGGGHGGGRGAGSYRGLGGDFGGAERDPFDFDGDAAEGEGGLPTEAKQLKDAVLVVVDCSQRNALAPLKPGGRSLLAEALAASATLLKRKVVSSPEDRVGVALYGVRETQNPNGFEGIRVLQDLDRPSAQRIKQLEAEIARPAASFEERYGYGRAVPLSDVFWTCTTIFNLSANAKQFEPRVWLFTSCDSPCETVAERDAAETRARDLRDIGVHVEFFPLPPSGSRFVMERFWDRVIPVDIDDYVDKAIVTLDNLERWIRMREHRKRTLQRLTLELCPGSEMAVSIFCTMIEASAPHPVYLLNENNKPLKSETKSLCGATGAILHPVDDVETFVELAGERIYMTRAEIEETKQFGEPGMQLLGFKSASKLLPHHRIFHSYFVYPNERVVAGSSALCQAMIDTMLDKNLMAIIRYIARRNAAPCLAALLPQAELVDEDGIQTRSPGFHMVRLPWGEEVRGIELPSPAAFTGGSEALTPELGATARRVVSAMRLDGFRPGCAENPVLQKHYAAVQALALGEDKPAETVDVIQPDATALEEKAPLFDAWRAAIDAAAPVKGAGGSSTGGKRSAPLLPVGAEGADAGNFAVEGRAVRPRREGPPAAPASLEGMRELVFSGEVERLTVPVLKDFLKAQGIVSSGKKSDLVDRVKALV